MSTKDAGRRCRQRRRGLPRHRSTSVGSLKSTSAARVRIEAELGLSEATRVERDPSGRTWTYRLRQPSRDRVRAIVMNPVGRGHRKDRYGSDSRSRTRSALGFGLSTLDSGFGAAQRQSPEPRAQSPEPERLSTHDLAGCNRWRARVRARCCASPPGAGRDGSSNRATSNTLVSSCVVQYWMIETQPERRPLRRGFPRCRQREVSTATPAPVGPFTVTMSLVPPTAAISSSE